MALLSLYDQSLRGRRDTPALEVETADGLRSFTFGELDARSDRMAQCLRARGLAAGDRLAVLLPNQVEVIDLWLAAVKLGVIFVPINVLYTAREIAHIVQDADPRAVITLATRRGDVAPGVPVWDIATLADDAAALPSQRPEITASAGTPAALIYTSGTTGASKGAVLTHGNFAANALALLAAWQISAADRYLATLPLFHVHGLGNGIQCWLASGCHMKLVERFAHEQVVGWFDAYRPTLFFGVPTMYVRLLELPTDVAQRIGGGMRLFVSGSAPLPAAVLESFEARFGHRILERYGMTETLMNVSNPYVGERRAGTVGYPLPMTDVEIRDAAGAPVVGDATGELWVRGPNVCAGYWRRPDATAAAFVDGWFRTGDFGSRDPDGRITLHGRRSDLIISGGFNIYPREIEELLLQQPGVREAAVVGAADARRGEVPVAYVVTDDGLDTATLLESLRASLASFKLPRRVLRVDALPRTALGKVQKHLLPPTDSVA